MRIVVRCGTCAAVDIIMTFSLVKTEQRTRERLEALFRHGGDIPRFSTLPPNLGLFFIPSGGDGWPEAAHPISRPLPVSLGVKIGRRLSKRLRDTFGAASWSGRGISLG